MDGGYVYYCATMYIHDTYHLQHRQWNLSTYLIFYELLLLGSLLGFLFRLRLRRFYFLHFCIRVAGGARACRRGRAHFEL